MNVSTPVIGQYSLCANYAYSAVTGAILTVACLNSTLPGSNVFVLQENTLPNNILQLCEVEVYGTGID